MSVFDDNWDFKIDISEALDKLLGDFKTNVSDLTKEVSNHLDEFHVQNFNNTSVSRNSDDELKIITERNKQLALEIKDKLEEYEKQQVQYAKYKNDQKQLAKEIKDTHEAFLMAKKFYKKFLKIYFTVESVNEGKQAIHLQFFTDVKKESKKYSVNLLKNTKMNSYEIVLLNPSLDILKEVQQKLQVTNDIPGALCYIWQAFLQIKKSKTK